MRQVSLYILQNCTEKAAIKLFRITSLNVNFPRPKIAAVKSHNFYINMLLLADYIQSIDIRL